MPIIVILIIALLVFSLAIHVLIMRLGTHIGETGHRNALLQNLLCLLEAFCIFLVGGIWITSYGASGSRLYAILAILGGCVLLIGGIIGLKGTLGETPDDLVTEYLSDIRIVLAGYHNQDRKLEGTANGAYSCFMLRGADKALAKRISESGRDHVTVVYHSSTRRIESISM